MELPRTVPHILTAQIKYSMLQNNVLDIIKVSACDQVVVRAE